MKKTPTPRRGVRLVLLRWQVALACLLGTVATRTGRTDRDDRGDVPGWVLVTVMSAGIVVAIGALATEQLQDLLRYAFNKVR